MDIKKNTLQIKTFVRRRSVTIKKEEKMRASHMYSRISDIMKFCSNVQF